MALQLKVGDRVMLKETSRYVTNKNAPDNLPTGFNPIGVVGTIIFVGSSTYSIDWDNTNSNGGYDDSDVELYVKSIKPKRRRLLI